MRFLKSIPALLASLIGAAIDFPVDGMPRPRRMGDGKARALAREAAQRLRQTERLANAAPPVETRQQRRAAERKDRANIPLTPTQRAYMHMTDQFPTYPKGTFAH